MLFPIIRVKDGDYTHIVGTNTHDSLVIDEESGGIHYMSMQNMEGTKKFGDGFEMEFVPKEMESEDLYPEIEFVTLGELIKIATDNMISQTDSKIKMHKALSESMKKYFQAKTECKEKLKDDNVIRDSSGRCIF